MSTLYELTGEYLALMDLAEDADPDVLRDTLEGIEGEIEDKADNYAKVVRSLEGEVNALEEEIARLQSKRKVLVSNIQSIKSNLERCMIATDKKKIKTLLFSFNIQKNPPTVNIKDSSKIPEEFWKQKEPELDKAALKIFLKEHGNTEYAELVQGESLRIR